MRAAFIQGLTRLAGRDRRVVLLTGDLGYTVLEPFVEAFPDRFFNAGVAEQNLVGLATGLAEAGFFPFIYSIATFATLRAYEFIRNGPVLHGLPVRVIGVGGGFEYGTNGATHYALEDLALMRVQPGMSVVAPADHQQALSALLETWDLPGPVYYRLGKDERTLVPGLGGRFEFGRAQLVRAGSDLLLVALGAIAGEAVAAADFLARRNVSCAVMVVASLGPTPPEELAAAFARFPLALSVEAHYVAGGLGSLVAEVIAEQGLRCRLVRCGVRSRPDGVSGSQSYLQQAHGISAEAMAMTALRALEGAKS